MINVTFYVFGKRKNSTALPTSGTTTAVVPVLLKEECSAEKPILELDSQDPDNYFNYTYCYIPFFKRYYFVDSWDVLTGRRIVVHCSEDYLGSFKSAIQLSAGFIKYSASGGVLTIPDPRMIRTIGYTMSVATADSPLNFAQNSYFISVVGSTKTAVYNISKANLYKLFEDVSWISHSMSVGSDDKTTLTNFGNMLGDLIDEVVTQGSIFNYLRSAYIIPLAVDEECLASQTTVIAGHYNTGIYANELVVPVYSSATAISIPWMVNDWRRCSPFTEAYVYLPFFGVIPLDVNSMIDSSYLTIKYSICYSDGGLSYSIETENNRIIATGSTNVRSEYGLGSSNVGNLGGYAANLMSGVSGALAGMEKIGSFGENLFNNLSETLNQTAGILDMRSKGGISTAGGLGGMSATGLERRFKCWTLTKGFSDVQANYARYFGYPLMQVGSLSDKTGFVQMQDFRFEYSLANLNEKDTISNYMNSGFYIE